MQRRLLCQTAMERTKNYLAELAQIEPSKSESPWNPHSADARRRGSTTMLATSHLSPPVPCELRNGNSSTSQIDDQGDSEYLKSQPRLKTQGVQPCATSFVTIKSDVAEIGARFPESQADTLIVNESQPDDEISLNENSPSKLFPLNLGDYIRTFRVRTASTEEKDFYPIDALEKAITRDRVLEALGNCENCHLGLDKVVDQIFERKSIYGHNTRRLKILVILALMYKPKAIIEFLKEGIYDIHLPFERRRTSDGTSRLFRKRRVEDGENQVPIICTDGWTQDEMENFDNKQYQVCIPIFQFPTDESTSKVSHYNLHKQTILPFIQDDERSHTTAGGFGEVWRVQLHPAHHNLRNSSHEDNPDFAVKKLQHADDKAAEAFRMEVSALNRFSNRDHPHLIKLLCTYYWRGHYYFLFPWAKGNLEGFWKRFPEAPAGLKKPSTARWMSKQCLGLVEALKDIHTGSLEPSVAEHDRTRPVSAPKHGKHGDLKPENILYFGPAEVGDDLCSAYFKISDFGLAEWHTSKSLNVDGAKVKRTPTYMAPELEVRNGSTPSYDIWSLACVLLEFVTWYLCGLTEVEHFTTERLNEEGFNNHHLSMTYGEDIFFKYVKVPVKGLQEPVLGAMPKRNVTKEIAKLMEHEHCSDYTLDLLDFIKHNLLRMSPQKRATCDEIVKKFEEFNRNCNASADYCIKKLKRTPTRSRTDSSLLVSVDVEIRPEYLTELKQACVWGDLGTQPVEVTLTTTERFTMETRSVTSLHMYPDQPPSSRPPSLKVGRGPVFHMENLPTMREIVGRRSLDTGFMPGRNESPLGMYQSIPETPDATGPTGPTGTQPADHDPMDLDISQDPGSPSLEQDGPHPAGEEDATGGARRPEHLDLSGKADNAGSTLIASTHRSGNSSNKSSGEDHQDSSKDAKSAEKDRERYGLKKRIARFLGRLSPRNKTIT